MLIRVGKIVMILAVTFTIRRRGKEGQKMRLQGISDVCSRIVQRLTGMLKRTENSLNQHIKLKHRHFWEQLKLNNEGRDSKEEYRHLKQVRAEDISHGSEPLFRH